MNNLKELRNEKGLSTQALSKALKINHTTLNRLENGITALNDTYIIIFADFYNVSADYILGLSKFKNRQEFYKPIPIKKLDNLNGNPTGYIPDTVPRGYDVSNYFYVRVSENDYSTLYPYVIEPSLVLVSKMPLNTFHIDIILVNVLVNGVKKPYFKYHTKIGESWYHYQEDEFPLYSSPSLTIIDPLDVIGYVDKIIYHLRGE